VLEAAVEDRGSPEVTFDVAERIAVRFALTEGDGGIEGAPALAQLLEELNRARLPGDHPA
jgi:hypothetical protein